DTGKIPSSQGDNPHTIPLFRGVVPNRHGPIPFWKSRVRWRGNPSTEPASAPTRRPHAVLDLRPATRGKRFSAFKRSHDASAGAPARSSKYLGGGTNAS